VQRDTCTRTSSVSQKILHPPQRHHPVERQEVADERVGVIRSGGVRDDSRNTRSGNITLSAAVPTRFALDDLSQVSRHSLGGIPTLSQNTGKPCDKTSC